MRACIRLAMLCSIATASALGIAATPAWGHAALLDSSPPPGVRLEQSPSKVTLSFTEPLARKLTRVKLVAVESGDELAVDVSVPSSRELELVPGGPLPKGAYRVDWHTVSTLDGHALEGTFSFGVRAPAAGSGHALEQSPLARDGWLRVLARAVMYTTLLLFAGALILDALLRRDRAPWSWLVPSGMPGDDALRRRAQVVVTDVGLIAAAAAAAAAIADAADAASSLSASGLSDYLLGGLPGFARIATVLLIAIAVVLAIRGGRLAAFPVALALLSVAASGHANSAGPRLPTVALDWVHLGSAAAWLGGIALVVIVWGSAVRRGERELRLSVARHVLPEFGRLALPAFLLVATTGAVSALVQLGHLPALWETAYGRILLVKVALVGLIAAASYTHALRLRPRLVAANPHPDERTERRHWFLLRSEPALGLGVIVAATFLVAFPLPPRQLGEADEAAAAAASCDPCPLPRPAAGELAVADHAGSRLVAAWIRRDSQRLAGTIRIQDVQGEPVTMRPRIRGARVTACGPGCWRFTTAAERDVVEVSLAERGRRYVARLPARWLPGESERARKLLERTQRTMSRLHSMRELEAVTGGPGSFARTVYRLRAPDRFAYVTSGGSRSVVVGRTQWFRAAEGDWDRQRYGGGGPPFRTRSWFRWTPYAQEVRLLRLDRGTAELALMDPGTPVWFRLTVDLSTMRTVRDRMIARAHYMTRRYMAFNQPVTIGPPSD